MQRHALGGFPIAQGISGIGGEEIAGQFGAEEIEHPRER
jgi:hypothetical protein